MPYCSSIVHCHLNYNQTLTIHQPRFEDGQVSRCISNSLQLVVYERTDIILFLTGQFAILDLFETAPKGRILTTWKVPDNSVPTYPFPNATSPPTVVRDDTTKESKALRVKTKLPSKLQDAEQKRPPGSKQAQRSATSPQQVLSTATGSNENAAKYDSSPLQSPLDSHRSSQGTASAKRTHASLEALKGKISVPKLPGALDTHTLCL